MKKNAIYVALFLLAILNSFAQTKSKEFKVVGYYVPSIPAEQIPIDLLTHINFAFAIPAKTGDTLEPLRDPEPLKKLVSFVHKYKKEVFISIGGWGIGDGGGDDTRFHKMAERPEGRHTFVKNVMKFVRTYNVDGVDLDWEYPDEDSRSADDYVALVNELGDSLHAKGKKLTAAVISYGKKGYGMKKEALDKMDWINLMAYDDDYGPSYIKAHSPYSLAIKSLDYWTKERQIPVNKTLLGLPFYSKKGMGNYGPDYKSLLKDGASPLDDYWKGAFYNGTLTIEQKTRMAKERGCGGVMIWEISCDTNDEYSLLKAIKRGAQ
ncbi:glycosyl hydrolase family 18 protein [Runella aurantiaca]|uniref:chitinase n=1 Tax=Runella aurantiaca TaxID=2282308 RepID=A0A369I207_9BACT|nr:glycosyl hydrolase family 18 protein [Runella aurantiaca]RDB02910.1 glycoside hydrolase [Runella aurantiaca]